ncbi:MAG: hypothetical protein WBE45_13850 [Terriglobales bacterium]
MDPCSFSISRRRCGFAKPCTNDGIKRLTLVTGLSLQATEDTNPSVFSGAESISTGICLSGIARCVMASLLLLLFIVYINV